MTIKRIKTSLTIVAVILTVGLLLSELVFSATARDQLSLSQLVRETSPVPDGKSSLAATYTINIDIQPSASAGNVQITPPGKVYTDGAIVEFSAPVSLTPDFDSDYWRFTSWSGTIMTTTSPLQLLPTQNYNVTANFARRCFTLTLAHEGGGIAGANPTASPASAFCTAGKYATDETINLTALGVDGYRVAGWIGTTNDNSTAYTNTALMPAADHTITVIYEPICYTLTTAIDPASSGTISRAPEPNCPEQNPGSRYFVNTKVTLTAKPQNGYEFEKWTGTTEGDTTLLTMSFPMTKARDITAHFKLACHRLRLEHLPAVPDSGVDPSALPKASSQCTLGEYVVNENVTLTASPNKGWQMEDWIVDGNGLGITDEIIDLKFPALPFDAQDYTVTAEYIKQPTLQFKDNGYLVSESAGAVTVHVIRADTSSKTEEVTVDYATTPGTADPGAGNDYLSANGTLTFKKNETEKTFPVTINDNVIKDGDRDFFIELSNPQNISKPENGAALGTPSKIKVTIEDNEGPPRVNFSSPEFRVPESMASAGVTVTLSNASTTNIRFVFDVEEGGTATNGKDYSWDNPLAPIVPAKDTSRVIQVPLIPDDIDEPDETIFLTIPAVVSAGAQLGQLTEATLIIEDDDDAPGVHFAETEYFAREGDPTAPISVTLDAASSYPITVDYEVTKLSVGRQYAAQVTFEPGETVQVIDVPLDGYMAGDTLEVQLDSAVNAILSPPSSVTLTVFDKNRSDCYELTLQSNGNGNPPATTNIERSLGCRPGYFVRNEAIVVRAEPEPGWEIERWSGTQNDEDTSNENVVVMPDGNHTVTVFYITHAYLPNLLQQFASYFEGPDEVEPNNGLSIAQANGPLRSGREYHGGFSSANDEFDVYYIYLAQQGDIQVELTDIPAGRDYNLYLFTANTSLKGYSGSLDNNNEHIASSNLPKGVYYIAVHVAGSAPSSAKYNLKVVYE